MSHDDQTKPVNPDAGWPAPTCETCRWWTRAAVGHFPSKTQAQCRRHAPVPSLARYVLADDPYAPIDVADPREQVSTEFLGACWPLTEEDDFCGEHQPL